MVRASSVLASDPYRRVDRDDAGPIALTVGELRLHELTDGSRNIFFGGWSLKETVLLSMMLYVRPPSADYLA